MLQRCKERFIKLSKTKTKVMDVADKVGKPMSNLLAHRLEKYNEYLPRIDEKNTTKRKFSSTRGKLLKFN